LDEGVVGRRRVGVRSRGSIIEGSKDTGRSLSFNQFAYNGVVEDCYQLEGFSTQACPTFDGCPLDLLSHVLLLLCFEGELDEDLLEFLVDIIDTQLFETVILENLETAVVLARL